MAISKAEIEQMAIKLAANNPKLRLEDIRKAVKHAKRKLDRLFQKNKPYKPSDDSLEYHASFS